VTSRDPRDSALEAMLGGRARPGLPTPECLDAETLAAYAESGLTGKALAHAEAHLAGCAHCQVVIAAIVGAGDDAVAAPAPDPARPWWAQFRWLIPLTGAAAAVVLWMVVPADNPARNQPPVAPLASDPSSQPSPPREAASPETTAANRSQGPDVQAPPRAAKEAAPGAMNEPPARQGIREPEPRAEADLSARKSTPERLADADQLAKAEDRRMMAGAAPAAPPAGEERKTVEAARAAPPPPPAPAALSPPASFAPPTDLRTLDPGVRWRLADLGFVERSTDGGASWNRFDTGVRTRLRAGVCPSATTCWVVGDGGVVVRTADGDTWQRLASPTGENLAAVEATSAEAAVVRTEGGLGFSTGDGGTTWTRVP
jgi:hypothetical protein